MGLSSLSGGSYKKDYVVFGGRKGIPSFTTSHVEFQTNSPRTRAAGLLGSCDVYNPRPE